MQFQQYGGMQALYARIAQADGAAATGVAGAEATRLTAATDYAAAKRTAENAKVGMRAQVVRQR